MRDLTDYDRASLRGFCIDYAIRANTQRNVFCQIEHCAPIEKVISDARKIHRFIMENDETAVIKAFGANEN